MTVERLDPANISVAGGDEKEIRRYIESDFRIRSGMCPNGHGLMNPNDYGQECPVCHFSCNVHAENGTLS